MAATLLLHLGAASALRTPRLAVCGRGAASALRTPQLAVFDRGAADAHCSDASIAPPQFLRRRNFAGLLAGALLPRVAHAADDAELDAAAKCRAWRDGDGDQGENPCTALAEGNPLIERLQQKSRDNAERRKQEQYDLQVMTMGYDTYFATNDKNLVKDGATGKYRLLENEEYAALKAAGRIQAGATDTIVDAGQAPKAAYPGRFQ